MAFTYDLTTSRGQLRLTTADTNSAAYAFEDAEIDYWLTTAGTVTGAAVLAMRTLLADRARRVKAFAVGGQSYSDAAQVAGIVAWLRVHGGDLPAASVILPAELPMDASYDEVDPTP